MLIYQRSVIIIYGKNWENILLIQSSQFLSAWSVYFFFIRLLHSLPNVVDSQPVTFVYVSVKEFEGGGGGGGGGRER